MATNVLRRRGKKIHLSKKGTEVNGYDKSSSDDADNINESIATEINITFMFEEHKAILPEYTEPKSESDQSPNPTQERYDHLTYNLKRTKEDKGLRTPRDASQSDSPRSLFRKMCKEEDLCKTPRSERTTDFDSRYDCKRENTCASPQARSISNENNQIKEENRKIDNTVSNIDMSNVTSSDYHDGLENSLQESDVPHRDQKSNVETDIKNVLSDLQTSMIFGSNSEINVSSIKAEKSFNSPQVSVSLSTDQVPIKNGDVDSTLNSPRTPNDTRTSCFDFRTPNSKHNVRTQGTPLSNKRQKLRKLENTTENTPNKRKKRKTSSITDYELSEAIKTEVCDAIDNTDTESIKLLHDLDSVINFENIKVSEDILSFSVFSNMEDCNENEATTFNDPPVDPLLITTDDENAVNKTTSKTKSKSDSMNVTADKQLTRRCANNNDDNVTEEVPVESEKNSNVGISRRVTRLQKAKELKKLKISQEERNFLGEMKSKLRAIKIQLLHEVPPQHQIETMPWSTGLTKEQRKEFMKYSPLRVGPFSAQEDEIIMKNWRKFCEIHKWHPDDARQFYYLNGNYYSRSNMLDDRKKFPQFLANGLPWRSLHRVCRRFKNLHNSSNEHRRYTAYENRKILSELKNCPRIKLHGVVYKLAKLFNRTELSITAHYSRLKRRKKKQKEKNQLWPTFNWTIPAVNKFIKYLLRVTKSKNIRELKHAEIPNSVWMELDKELNIGYLKLKRFWLLQLHMQLFCTQPIYLNDIKIKLIEYIYGKGISHYNSIIWPNVAVYFEGMTTAFLRAQFSALKCRVAKNEKIRNFLDVIECLHDVYIPKIQDQRIDRYLPRLKYRNGTVEIVNEGVHLPK